MKIELQNQWEDADKFTDQIKEINENVFQKPQPLEKSISPFTFPDKNNFKELEFNIKSNIVQRDISKEDSKQNELNKQKSNQYQSNQSGRHSPRSQAQSSARQNSSKTSFNSQKQSNIDQRFLKELLKIDEKSNRKWYYYVIILMRFVVIQLLNPLIILIGLFSKNKKKESKKQFRKKCIIFLFKFYFFISAVFLWIAIGNYIYIRKQQSMSENEFILITSEYHKIFMYFLTISIAFTILDTSIFKNSVLFYYLFKSISAYSSINIPKFMKDIYISDHDFMFQFFNYPFEDEKKVKQKQKIKKIFQITDKKSQYFQNNELVVKLSCPFIQNQLIIFVNYQQFYSGLDFCEKIVQYSEKTNVENQWIILRQCIITVIIYLKAFIPGVYRYYTNEGFVIYDSYLTVVPYICVGNIVSYFSRTINSLQDLNFIYDYNRALSALITYDSYLKLKPKHKINTPSINPIDIKSIKTWSQMRKLLNELKKQDTVPIDRCTLFLFIYLALIFLAVFLDRFFKSIALYAINQDKFLVPYFSVDIVLISLLFCYRVYKQTQINNQYKQQFKLLQNLKNIIIRFFVNRDNYVEKENIQFLDKDTQWLFYSVINQNYMNCMQSKYIFEMMVHESSKGNNNPIINKNQGEKYNSFKQLDQQELDFQYSIKIINIIEYIQIEIEMDMLQTPMKFMGLFPSSYGLLWTFLSCIASFIYLAFYLYLNEVQ